MAAGDVVNSRDTAVRLATVPIIANSSTWATGTETGALVTASASLIAGETYKINLFLTISASVSADVDFVRIKEDNASGTQLLGACLCQPTPTGNGYPLSLYVEYTATATAVKTFVVTAQRIGGTGTHQIVASTARPGCMTVDRIVT